MEARRQRPSLRGPGGGEREGERLTPRNGGEVIVREGQGKGD